MTYLGSVASDRADYPRAVSCSRRRSAPRARCRASRGARRTGCPCWAGSACCAATSTRPTSSSGPPIDLAEREHWLSFLPWPQALLGHVLLARGDLDARRGLPRAVVRAGLPDRRPLLGGHLGPRSGSAGRGLGRRRPGDLRPRSTPARGPTGWRTPTSGSTCYILDALCEMGGRHGHPLTAAWVEEMHERASRAGMRELTVRAMVHGAAARQPGRRGGRGPAVRRRRQPTARAPGRGHRRQLRTRSSTAPYSATLAPPDHRGLVVARPRRHGTPPRPPGSPSARRC